MENESELTSKGRRKRRYWILKTTEGGPHFQDHWEDFQKERVVAVGWPIMKKDPRSFSDSTFYHGALPPRIRAEKWSKHAANTLWIFGNEWDTDDIAIICVGYAPNQRKDVHLYGYACVTGALRVDLKSTWWVFKRPARVFPIEKSVRLRTFRRIFGDSMLRTIHGPLSQNQFDAFRGEIEALYPGVFRELSRSIRGNKPTERYGPAEDRNGFAFPEEIEPTTIAALFEGAKHRVYVNAYERSRVARQRCIAHHGPRCCVCDLSFAETYGPMAEDFIHVHHLRKLAELGREYEIDPIADLRPICPNCHAVIHVKKEPLTIDAVKRLMEHARRSSRRP
jgi:hypothetical protein